MNDLDFMIWELWCIVIEIEEFEFTNPNRKRWMILWRDTGKFKELCLKKNDKTKEIMEYKKSPLLIF